MSTLKEKLLGKSDTYQDYKGARTREKRYGRVGRTYIAALVGLMALSIKASPESFVYILQSLGYGIIFFGLLYGYGKLRSEQILFQQNEPTRTRWQEQETGSIVATIGK